MNEDEERAQEFLKRLGFAELRYEPDGNVPPDFLCNKSIAVEVRRLDQHYSPRVRGAKRKRGLDQDAFPLRHWLRRTLADFGAPIDGKSWWFFYVFRRPLPPKPIMQAEIERAIIATTLSPSPDRVESSELQNFRFELIAAAGAHPDRLVLGGNVDRDSGGWLLSEMLANIERCIREKEIKVANLRRIYPTWWLILVNHVGPDLSQHDEAEFMRHWNYQHSFDRVSVISRAGPLVHFDVEAD
ncbi:hypothetical protein [Maricaulis sp.]|uniref:hypothetical protein n=1 Tax=Maricaulis sp. TaxID=1486257 RepID=UPI003A8D42CA